MKGSGQNQRLGCLLRIARAMKLEFASIRAGLRADLRSREVSARADATTEKFLVYIKARMRDGAEAGEFNRLADEFLATYPNHSPSEPVPYEPTGFMAGPAGLAVHHPERQHAPNFATDRRHCAGGSRDEQYDSPPTCPTWSAAHSFSEGPHGSVRAKRSCAVRHDAWPPGPDGLDPE